MKTGRIHGLMQAGIKAVRDAGPIACQHFRTNLQVDNKLEGIAFDPVTEADRAIERSIRDALSLHDNSLAIIGEEYGLTGTGSDYWIIDPIDGTRAFVSGMLGWGILLGLVMGGRAVGGIMYQPFTDELFYGTADGSILLSKGRTTTLRCSKRTDLRDAILYSTDPRLIQAGDLTAQFSHLAKSCRLQRWGGDCYASALVAMGSIDLVVEGPLAPYDIVPLIALVEGAGGIVSGLDGKPPMNGGAVIVAANEKLHAAAISILCMPAGMLAQP